MFDIASVHAFLQSHRCPYNLEYALQNYVLETWGTYDEQKYRDVWDTMQGLPRPLTLQQSLIKEAFAMWDGWDQAAENASLYAAETGAGMEALLDYQYHATHDE